MAEWGFKDAATAEAYWRRQQRVTQGAARQKMEARFRDPELRLKKLQEKVCVCGCVGGGNCAGFAVWVCDLAYRDTLGYVVQGYVGCVLWPALALLSSNLVADTGEQSTSSNIGCASEV
jgi:hypothetical protein